MNIAILGQGAIDFSNQNTSTLDLENPVPGVILTSLYKRPPRRDGTPPEIHVGYIGTSNSLIKDGVTRDQLGKKYKLLCLEMEAGGLPDGEVSRDLRLC